MPYRLPPERGEAKGRSGAKRAGDTVRDQTTASGNVRALSERRLLGPLAARLHSCLCKVMEGKAGNLKKWGEAIA